MARVAHWCAPNAREQGDADAARAVVGETVDVVAALQHLAHLLGHGTGLAGGAFGVAAQVADLHDELVAAQAGHRVVVAQQAGQALGHLLQERVTDRVPAGIVDVLEVVQVDKEQRALLA